jgi:hypothetical protein
MPRDASQFDEELEVLEGEFMMLINSVYSRYWNKPDKRKNAHTFPAISSLEHLRLTMGSAV